MMFLIRCCILVVSLFSFNLLSGSGLFAQETLQGSTFFALEGGDLGRLLHRKPDVDVVGNFVIQVDQLPENSAILRITAFDIDVKDGESNLIFFNDHKLGPLEGSNDSWSTTTFQIRRHWIQRGANQLKFVISDRSEKGGMKWSSKVSGGTLEVDGGSGETGVLRTLELRRSLQDQTLRAATSFYTLKSGNFRVQTTLFNPESEVLLSKTRPYTANRRRKRTVEHLLPFKPTLPSGFYTVQSQLFALESGKWIAKNSLKRSFHHLSSALTIAATIDLQAILMTEDAPALEVDVSRFL